MRHLLLSLCLPVAMLLSACSQPSVRPTGSQPSGSVAELQRIDEWVGEGAEAVSGTNVTVHYTGWLFDQNAPEQRGRKFDSSLDRGQPFTFPLGGGRVIRGQPFTFPLGGGRVIRGWDEGVAGMKAGGKRVLLIPAEFGYGDSGAGNGVIPPNASLVFEVELLDVKPR